MGEPLISILIPVYNVEQYLAECIESVIHQTYHNIEIILVNNGSTDSSGNICNEYKGKDGRISVIHKKNNDVSDARNSALDAATGDWVLFVDSDDTISRHACETLLYHAIKTKSDIAVAQVMKFWGAPTYQDSLINSNVEVISSDVALCRYLYRIDPGYAAGKLYRRTIISDLRFPSGKIFEDMFLVPRYLYRAERIVILHDYLYYYRQRENSIVHAKYTSEKLDALDAVEETEQLLANKSEALSSAICSRKFVVCVDLLGRVQGVTGFDSDKARFIQGIRETNKPVLCDRHNTFLVRFMALLSLFSPRFIGWCSSNRGYFKLRKRV